MAACLRSAACAVLALAAAASVGAQTLSPLLRDGAVAPAWRFVGLPQQKLPRTAFDAASVDGQTALRITAVRSYGQLVHMLPPDGTAHRLRWRWRIDEANGWTDLRRRPGDDSAVRVCVWFDMPREALPLLDGQLLDRTRKRSVGLHPGATLCYVWDPRATAVSLIESPFSSRVRVLVLRGEEAAPGTWQSESRDIAADFLRAFGNETTRVPPALAVTVVGDADNTGARSIAWIADLQLE